MNGMDMDMGMDNSTTASTMQTQFITQLGMSNLWFASWTPTSSASTFGAAMGLFFLAIFSRLLAAVSVAATKAWSDNIALLRSYPLNESAKSSTEALGYSDEKKEGAVTEPKQVPHHTSLAPPFVLAHDLPRGVLFAFQAFVGYLLMLAVMTYNAWFFIAIILGLGVGEMGFGRWSSGLATHGAGGFHL